MKYKLFWWVSPVSVADLRSLLTWNPGKNRRKAGSMELSTKEFMEF